MRKFAQEESMKTGLREIINRDCEEVVAPAAPRLDMLKNRLVYITGGTGFVGTWISEAVAFLNDQFRFNTCLILVSRNPDSFREKAPHLASRKDIELLSLNVKNIFEIPSDVSYIIHAAASPDNRQHVSDPLDVMQTITSGTGALLDTATGLTGLKKILNISSGQIYGRQLCDMEAIPESYAGSLDCNSINSVYPESKRYAETLCCAYWSLYKVPVVIARPFAFIGPYLPLDRPWALNNFIRDALMNKTIRIIGNGLPVRSYMYPSDMAVWMLRILIEGAAGAAYNVGSPYSISLRELAEKVKLHSQTASSILIKNLNDDKSKVIPDITRSRTQLALDVGISVDEAIKRSIVWYRNIKLS